LIAYSPPLGNIQLVSESYSLEKSLTTWRGDVEDREEDEVPPRFNDENNTNNNQEDDKSGASGVPSL
jgi:hypothetical protein